jgi:hypothetical protein
VVVLEAYEATRCGIRAIWRKLDCLYPNLQQMKGRIRRKDARNRRQLCVGMVVGPIQPSGRGAMSNEGIEGDMWDA